MNVTPALTQIFISCEAASSLCGQPFGTWLRAKHEVSVCLSCAVFFHQHPGWPPWARSPEPQMTCIIKALFKHPGVFQDLQHLCFIFAVLFFLFSLFAVTHRYIYIQFKSSKKSQVFRMCYSLYGHIQVMGNAEEQLNETRLWEFMSRAESFHCHF